MGATTSAGQSVATKIKICGITRPADARAVVAAGADALGLAFVQHSKRRISLPLAAEIAQDVGGQICRVGLFVNPTEQVMAETLAAVELDMLQFHGDEAPEFCAKFGLPYCKAFSAAADFDATQAQQRFTNAHCLMLDAQVAGQLGGTGHRFDTRYWPANVPGRWVLAGGLTPDNVATAVQQLRPYAVDLSSGAEHRDGAQPAYGKKDPERVRRLVEEVQRADALLADSSADASAATNAKQR